jgi:hypothetical protein
MKLDSHFLYVVVVPALLVGVVGVAGWYQYNARGIDPSPIQGTSPTQTNDEDQSYKNPRREGTGTLAADTFKGTLTEVTTGCFADGECSVTVDGKHVTAIMGWSRDVVGSVEGVEGFGDLEKYLGKEIEVYAQRLDPQTYTLYGSEGFYIRLPAGTENNNQRKKDMSPTVSSECAVGGCSSQLCVPKSAGDVVSTCEYKEEYGCYQSAACERQQNGECGWTQTEKLRECVLRSQKPQVQ